MCHKTESTKFFVLPHDPFLVLQIKCSSKPQVPSTRSKPFDNSAVISSTQEILSRTLTKQDYIDRHFVCFPKCIRLPSNCLPSQKNNPTICISLHIFVTLQGLTRFWLSLDHSLPPAPLCKIPGCPSHRQQCSIIIIIIFFLCILQPFALFSPFNNCIFIFFFLQLLTSSKYVLLSSYNVF